MRISIIVALACESGEQSFLRALGEAACWGNVTQVQVSIQFDNSVGRSPLGRNDFGVFVGFGMAESEMVR